MAVLRDAVAAPGLGDGAVLAGGASLRAVGGECVAGPWELPPEWVWTTLDAVAAFIGRGRGPTYVETGGVPVINQKCIRWRSVDQKHLKFTAREAFDRLPSTLVLRAGDILWNSTGSGTIGRAAIHDGASGEITCDSHVTIVRLREVDPAYIAYLIETARVQRLVTEGNVGSTSQLELPRSFVEDLSIPLPPLAEQRRIVARIDALFAEIAEGEAALNAARTGLETFRRALLKAAVTGELTREWRAATTLGPSDWSADLLTGPPAPLRRRQRPGECTDHDLDEASLPPIPESWEWKPLEAIISEGPANGYSPKASTDGSGTRSLKLTATTSGTMRLDGASTKCLSETIDTTSGLFLLPGDLLFQRGNTIEYVGIAAIFDGPSNTYVYPDLMIRIRTSMPTLTEWIWRVANSPFGRKFMMDNATGTAGTMPKISGAVLRRFPIPLPPPDEAAEILRRVTDALAAHADTLAQLDAETADAARLRQSVLKAAFEGRLVPQDPADEPARALLERLAQHPTPPRGRGRTKRLER